MDQKAFLTTLFQQAVHAVAPATLISKHLGQLVKPPVTGKTLVIGAGKAAAAMAHAVEKAWQGELSGLVVTRYGHGAPCQRIEVIEAAHPVPDSAGLAAAQRILSLVRGLRPEDLVLCLISGGGSSLLTLPAPGLTLEDKRAINLALLRSGAAIGEMNCVRRHLSAIKGGRLALACYPAQVITLLISDIPGDDPSIIASGPTIPDHSTAQDALKIMAKYQIPLADHVRTVLENEAAPCPTPDHPFLKNCRHHVIGTAQIALEAAAAYARSQGITPIILGGSIEGEARDIASMHAAIARQILTYGQPGTAPCVLLSGGETTVTLRGEGRGGRNAEFLLALTQSLQGLKGVYSLAGDTDGIDGTEAVAAYLAGPNSLDRAKALGLDAKSMLNDNDGYSFFAALEDCLITGPTRTNVNDFRAILIEES
ncbi:glycerate kinase type-2 family protein [Parvibium lacunae]|nr:glycerate kinase [Parvibium lacunae]